MAPRAQADDGVTGRGEFKCEKCGRTFTNGAWYTKHALHCDGEPATSGRIAARGGTAVLHRGIAVVDRPAHRPRLTAPDEKTARRRAQYRASADRRRNGHADRTPPAAAVVAIAAAATDKATEIVIAGLMAKRELIDRAIAALQAVA